LFWHRRIPTAGKVLPKDLLMQGAQHPPFQENQHSTAGSGNISHRLYHAMFPPLLSTLYVKIRIKVLLS